MPLELVIKMSNQKEISAKCFLGATEKCRAFKKIGDLYHYHLSLSLSYNSLYH